MERGQIGLAVIVAIVASAAVPMTACAAGVGFIAPDAVSIAVPNASKPRVVELFNGSRSRQRLSLRVLGGARTAVRLVPRRSIAGPGGTGLFAVTLSAAPAPGEANGTLLATSSDGTSARLPLALGPAAPPSAKIPSMLDVGARLTGKGASVTVPGLSGSSVPATVGSLFRAGAEHVSVSVQDGKLVVAGADKPGKYSGDIDVNASAPGGESTVTMRVRRNAWWAFIPLLLGIAIGFAIEWWLTRWRPRGLLDRRLGRLIQRTEARRWRVERTLTQHFDRGRGKPWRRYEGWRLPQAALACNAGGGQRQATVDTYYFTRAGSELAKGLADARTDPERELFGPDGDKFLALLADETVYRELVGELREATFAVDSVFVDLKDTEGVPMRERFDYELRGWAVGDEMQLAARCDAAKALRIAAEHFAEFYRRINQAERLHAARTPDDGALATEIAGRRDSLVHTFHGDDDQVVAWALDLPALESAVYIPAAAPPAAPAAVSPKATENDNEDEQAAHEACMFPPVIAPSEDTSRRGACCRHGAPDVTEPVENPDAIPPWEPGGTLRGGTFTTAEWLVGAASLLTILGSGMAAIYLVNDTFGSTGDLVSALLWGSTATTGLALLRRLLPGGLTTLRDS